ncbi:hypothetical protein Taro_023401 [Colocasia esculenta]|uniref:Peptidase S54 rhomboid domain-containing protein n=1 Tax=Colocasia esculenta TaxID=4460 RepID=A0A843V884_COLES|nr:hypothetical protein [Colocasia esculenta]
MQDPHLSYALPDFSVSCTSVFFEKIIYIFFIMIELQTRETTSPSSTNDDSESSLMRRNVIDEAFYEETANKISTHDDLPLERMDSETVPAIFSEKSMQDSQTYDEASDFYLINLLASIDIAVFLFEIASPVRSSDVEQLSLPFIYGAKINQLILDGEWWRIVTPMFLLSSFFPYPTIVFRDLYSVYNNMHSGFLHISLGCWALLTFGPQVCRGYSPFTFFLIYVLGGISANMTSFIHTPGLTVCGTSTSFLFRELLFIFVVLYSLPLNSLIVHVKIQGPAFAVIGAWLIYQVQNKEAIAKEVSENMFWKAVLATALGFVISNFEHVDEWSHMGAVFSGLIYGFLTRPAALSDKTPSDNSQKEGITLLKHQADPCRSAAIFTLCICVLCSLVFVFEPGLETLVM